MVDGAANAPTVHPSPEKSVWNLNLVTVVHSNNEIC